MGWRHADLDAVGDGVGSRVAVGVESGGRGFADIVSMVAGQLGEGGNGRTDGIGEVGGGSEIGGGKFVVEGSASNGGGKRVTGWDSVVDFVGGNAS